MRTSSWIVLLLASLACAAGCSKTSSGPSRATGNSYVAAAAFWNPTGNATIWRTELLFDGKVIGAANFNPPGSAAELSGTIEGVKKGTHTLSIRIASQTSSPTTYEVIYAMIVPVMSGNETYEFGSVQRSVATGESIGYSFEF